MSRKLFVNLPVSDLKRWKVMHMDPTGMPEQ